jgi:hypothetical protein
MATTTATTAAIVGTPTDRGNKAAHPQGTSPMARDAETDDNLDIQPLDLGIDGDGKTSANKDDQNSVTREISSTRKELFESASTKSSVKSSKAATAWRPIVTRDTPAEATAASKGATFAAETVFHERSPPPLTATRRLPGKTTVWCACASSYSHATSKKPSSA